MSTTSFQYLAVSQGHLPIVLAGLAFQGRYSENFKFLVDSGAQFSFAPKGLLKEIFPEIVGRQEEATPCLDIHGQYVTGTALTVHVCIDGLPEISEPIWFSEKVTKSVLGQTFFEHVEVRFRNFHPDRRVDMASPANVIKPTFGLL